MRRIPEFASAAKPKLTNETVITVKLNPKIKRQQQIDIATEDKKIVQTLLSETETQSQIQDEDVLQMLQASSLDNGFFHQFINSSKCIELSMLLCDKLKLPPSAQDSLPVMLKQISSFTFVAFRDGIIKYQDLLNNALGL